ncbi:hypothetical protein Fcan01_06590 [Folsomia candida]|uniref:Uncharacterized protein n=1 Tax=Folsomia candida TaxID=158441 RepID=A0A226ELP9_FOLCA|nr:hypothetical protein Fcan01_06590 [Folsomia candida]
MAASKFLKCNPVDYHRRRMGLSQKFKNTKFRKEKPQRFSTVEEKLKIKYHPILLMFLLFIFLIIPAAIYGQLQENCEPHRGEKLTLSGFCLGYQTLRGMFVK